MSGQQLQATVRASVGRILGLICAFGTATAVVGWALQLRRSHMPTWLELVFGIVNLPVNFSLVSAVVMVILTGTILRRKRVGWWALVGLQLIGIWMGVNAAFGRKLAEALQPWRPSSMSRVADLVSIPVGFALIGLLLWVRREFAGQLRPSSRGAALGTLIGGLGITATATAFLVGLTRPGPFVFSWQGSTAVIARSAGFNAPWIRITMVTLPRWLPGVTGTLISLTLLVAVWVLLRTVTDPARWSLARERDLRGLVANSRDSLAYFATRRDKSSVFAPGGRAAVTYRVVHGVSLASGDPLGEPAHWPSAISAWLKDARQHGWIPAVISASEAGARAYVAGGLRVLKLGDEAILDPVSFAAAQAADPQLRRAVRHVAAAGVRIQVRRQDRIEETELAELVTAANAWRHGRIERGFSMALGREADPSDGRCVIVSAHDSDGRPVGLLTFVPWGASGLSLDLMRRSPDAPNGITEAMVTAVMEKRLARRVSLNFCMFRSVFEDSRRFGATSVERLGCSVLGILDRFWQLERLYRANRQYGPAWCPRYVCYPESALLPHVAFAAGVAEGLLPSWSLNRLGHSERLDCGQARFVTELAAPASTAAVSDARQVAPSRLGHLAALEAKGAEGYPCFTGDRPLPVKAAADRLREADGQPFPVVGRVRRIRDHGRVIFVDLIDGAASLQLRLQADPNFSGLVDSGDLLRVSGTAGTSRSGDLVLDVAGWDLAAKALRPIRFDRWSDTRQRSQHRSEDLITRPDALVALRTRSRIVDAVRSTLRGQDFWEVETPVLHEVHGGASARPFRTTLNAFHTDLSLRIAPELYLKRLLVAGSGPIFEVSRNFRNEGVDATHNPEFTSVEAYRPYADYHDMRRLTQDLVRQAALAAHGRPSFPVAGDWIDLEADWPVIPVLDAVSSAVGEPVTIDLAPEELLAIAGRCGVDLDPDWGTGRMIETLYGDLVEPLTRVPTFYIDFPAETSPLARGHRTQPGLAERWDLVAKGMELGTAYTELTDPRVQRERFVEQSLAAAAGDVEAMEVDEAFLGALELGMPPTGGLGLGLDRLVMLLVDQPIREVLSFPLVRNQGVRS